MTFVSIKQLLSKSIVVFFKELYENEALTKFPLYTELSMSILFFQIFEEVKLFK